ncbi:unnamed protein product (macronuclear) [Paramecium tetraurelia]|uniref:G-protein coupled receptors family 1 profile domain-containing protein n=1 Tax=Paramecium tetraurelia TaxID=5888 RepID=A0D8M3_PARTE|nr:uncharacterized protein GSPATT00014336001 [Paramecium tetraurelia]CAK79390.1 unnamed protein product [Paramecium tetraurelia]|eukprot:XP_001446787.1 hypothetical protein (macronuclear) [Paramecium tetraurelia strain d4-2]
MKLLFYIFISLSVGGSTLMLTHLYFFDNMRVLAQRILFFLSISDFLYSIGLLLYVEPAFSDYNKFRFYVLFKEQQLNLEQQVLFCGAHLQHICYTFQSFKDNKELQNQRDIRRQSLYQVSIKTKVGFAIPILMSTPPLFFDSYAPTPQKVPVTCSISSNDENKSLDENRNLSLYLNLMLFYIPLIFTVLISVYFIMRSYFKIKKIKSQYELLTKQINIQLIFAKTLIFYPFGLCICWLPSLIVFLIFTFNNEWFQEIQINYFISGSGDSSIRFKFFAGVLQQFSLFGQQLDNEKITENLRQGGGGQDQCEKYDVQQL